MLAATIANAHRGRHQRPFKPQDFMPRFAAGREPKTDEEIGRKLAQLLTPTEG